MERDLTDAEMVEELGVLMKALLPRIVDLESYIAGELPRTEYVQRLAKHRLQSAVEHDRFHLRESSR